MSSEPEERVFVEKPDLVAVVAAGGGGAALARYAWLAVTGATATLDWQDQLWAFLAVVGLVFGLASLLRPLRVRVGSDAIRLTQRWSREVVLPRAGLEVELVPPESVLMQFLSALTVIVHVHFGARDGWEVVLRRPGVELTLRLNGFFRRRLMLDTFRALAEPPA